MRKIILLSLAMFLQYMMLPVWFVPMIPYVQALPGGQNWATACGFIMALGTLAAPLLGMFADRFFRAERVLASCNILCAALLAAASCVGSPALLFAILLLAMLFYMPTWSLMAAIGMAHLDKSGFARVRLFGTVGWMASGFCAPVATKLFGLADFDTSSGIFAAGALIAATAAALAFALPPTESAAKDKPMSLIDALGLRALVLFRNRSFLGFMILLFLAMIPYQWYNVYGGAFLKSNGFGYLTLTMNIGKIGALAFMLCIPWIMGHFGFLRLMLAGILVLIMRDACLLGSSAGELPVLGLAGVFVNGFIYNIFIVGSQMYIGETAPRELRNQAQGLVNLLTAGAGVFVSNALFDFLLRQGPAGMANWTAAFAVALGFSTAIALALVPALRKAKGLRT